MRRMVQVVGMILAVTAWGCGGTSTPASPSPASGGGALTTIAILGNDDRAFEPIPADAPQGTAVVWANSDDTAHHVVATDGSFDTGVIAPGAKSAPIVMTTDGAHYYCAIHPTELGSINASTGYPPPCSGAHCQ